MISLGLSSCATIFCGSRQSITFDAKMPEVSIYREGVKLGETKNDGTFTTKIGKELSSLTMMAKKEGYKKETFFLETKFNGVACINLLNPVAWAIDLGTGNACKYERNYVEIEMEKEK